MKTVIYEEKIPKATPIYEIVLNILVCVAGIVLMIVGWHMNKTQPTPPVLILYPVYNFMKYYYGLFLIMVAIGAISAYAGIKHRKNINEKKEKMKAQQNATGHAMAEHEALLKEMLKEKNKAPNASKYRFFFEVPFDASAKEPDFTREWLERGDLKLFKDVNKVGIDGFEFGTECAFHELAEYIGGNDIIAIYGDINYLQNHQTKPIQSGIFSECSQAV